MSTLPTARASPACKKVRAIMFMLEGAPEILREAHKFQIRCSKRACACARRRQRRSKRSDCDRQLAGNVRTRLGTRRRGSGDARTHLGTRSSGEMAARPLEDAKAQGRGRSKNAEELTRRRTTTEVGVRLDLLPRRRRRRRLIRMATRTRRRSIRRRPPPPSHATRPRPSSYSTRQPSSPAVAVLIAASAPA